MRFSLHGWYDDPEGRFHSGTYYVNKIVHEPSVGFTDLQEALAEAKRLDISLYGYTRTRKPAVKTIEVRGGVEIGIIHEYLDGNSTYFNLQGHNDMAKFTLTAIPQNVERFWVVVGHLPTTGGVVHCFDSEIEAKEEAAKMFAANQGQKKLWLMGVTAVIDAVVPQVAWRDPKPVLST